MIYYHQTLRHTYNSEHSNNFLNPAFKKETKGGGAVASDEFTPKNLHLNKETQNVELDEDFNGQMNENVEAYKIKNKLAKCNSHNESNAFQIGAIPEEKNDIKNRINGVRADLKRGSIIGLKRNASKKATVVLKQEIGDNDQRENTTDGRETTKLNDSMESLVNDENHILSWEYLSADGLLKDVEPPELIVKLTSKDLSTTSLQICIWGLHSTEPL